MAPGSCTVEYTQLNLYTQSVQCFSAQPNPILCRHSSPATETMLQIFPSLLNTLEQYISSIYRGLIGKTYWKIHIQDITFFLFRLLITCFEDFAYVS